MRLDRIHLRTAATVSLRERVVASVSTTTMLHHGKGQGRHLTPRLSVVQRRVPSVPIESTSRHFLRIGTAVWSRQFRSGAITVSRGARGRQANLLAAEEIEQDACKYEGHLQRLEPALISASKISFREVLSVIPRYQEAKRVTHGLMEAEAESHCLCDPMDHAISSH